MKIVEGGVTKAKGFEAASTAAKIKYAALDSSPDTHPCSHLKSGSETGIASPADAWDII